MSVKSEWVSECCERGDVLSTKNAKNKASPS